MIEDRRYQPNKLLIIFSLLTLLCVAFAAVSFSLSNIKLIDKGKIPTSITVIGEGEVKVIPDSATIIATIRDSGPTIRYARGAVDVRTKNLYSELEEISIETDDIRSLSYSTRPKYELRSLKCEVPPCGSKSHLIGYEAAQTFQIKSYKVELTSEIMTRLDLLDIKEISGPNFSLENNEKPKAEARLNAIKNSQIKAKEIAQAFNVKLGKVINFEEDNNISKKPIHFSKGQDNDPTSQNINLGEDTIKASVTVTYSLISE